MTFGVGLTVAATMIVASMFDHVYNIDHASDRLAENKPTITTALL
jgi:hypothetical protein